MALPDVVLSEVAASLPGCVSVRRLDVQQADERYDYVM